MPRIACLRRLAPALLLLALGACATPATPPLPDPRYQPASAADILAQTSWELARWTRPGGALREVPHAGPGANARPITISFTHEQGQPRIAGFAGCNAYSGQYTIANGLLIVTAPPLATHMACAAPRMRLEQDFLAGLTRITATSLDNSNRPQRLTLALASGDILDFGRRTDPAVGGQQGATKLVYVNAQRVQCDRGGGEGLCYQVRDSASQPWQNWYGEITGFDFQPGSIYRLRIVEVPEPYPAADMSSVRWVLDAVVEQRVVGY